MRKIKVFLFFDEKNYDDLYLLQQHLATYEAGIEHIQVNSTSKIPAGTVLLHEICQHLCDSDIIVLGYSADLLVSDAYKSVKNIIQDMQFFRGKYLVPILLKECNIDDIKGIKTLPKKEQVISKCVNKSSIYHQIAKDIINLINECQGNNNANTIRSQVTGIINHLAEKQNELNKRAEELDEQKQEIANLLYETVRLKSILKKSLEEEIKPYQKIIGDLQDRLTAQENSMKQLRNSVIPLYRLWSANGSDHFYTISEQEREHLVKNSPDWKFEGISGFVLAQKPQ